MLSKGKPFRLTGYFKANNVDLSVYAFYVCIIYFLNFDNGLVSAIFLFLFRLLVLEFGIVHNFAHGRYGIGLQDTLRQIMLI